MEFIFIDDFLLKNKNILTIFLQYKNTKNCKKIKIQKIAIKSCFKNFHNRAIFTKFLN